MKPLYKAWWISLFAKFVLASTLPLNADEAYYWVWSLHPQLSYYDHPPFVAWLFNIGNLLPEFMVRWPSLLLFHLGYLFWFKLLETDLEDRKILWWFLICQMAPLTGLGSILVLPDAPLFTFFSGSLYFFQRALISGHLRYFALFGAFLGLAFLSKYIIVIAALLLLVFALWKRLFKALTFKNLAVLVTCGLIFSLPVLIWNFQNDFQSFQFQLRHGLAKGSWNLEWTLSYIVGTLFLAYPPYFIKLYFSKLTPNLSFLKFLAWGGFGFFLYSSFKGSVELNWPSIFYPCLFACVLTGLSLSDIKKVAAYWFVIYVGLASILSFFNIPDLQDKLSQPYKLREWRRLSTDYAPLYTTTYQLASLMWWNSKIPTYKLHGSSRYDFFDELLGGKPQVPLFHVLKEEGNNLPDWIQPAEWEIEEVQRLDDKHLVVRVFRKAEL